MSPKSASSIPTSPKSRKKAGAGEFHAGLGSVLPYSTGDYAAFESEVRKLAVQLEEYEGG